MAKYVPSEEDSYAIAVASVDENAWLYGESVLDLLNLCATNPKVIYIAVNKRIRKQLPKNIQIIYIADNKQTKMHKGIKCQPVKDAIYSCIGKMLTDRLGDALVNAKEQGYITLNEHKQLKKDIRNAKIEKDAK